MRRIMLVSIVLIAGGCAGKSTAEWIELTKSKDSAERIHAVKALAERTREASAVVSAIADLLKDPDAFVRRDAAAALRKFGADAKPAIPALLVAQSDKNVHVRDEAVKSIREIDPTIATKPSKK